VPLKIAFLGYNAPQTARYLAQLAEDNAEQVAWFLRRHGRLAMKDGTVIVNAYCVGKFDGLRFDQIILADDRRMEITRNQAATIGRLLDCCTGSIIPPDFRVQIYDIDEEAPT
jgi:hypothetical protein